MAATLGDDTPALSTVQKWAAEFKRARENLKDDPRSGRPAATATTQENIDCLHHMIMGDRRLTVNQIGNTVGVSGERVENILHKELDVSKVSPPWVPRLLTSDQKHTRIVMSHANLTLFEADRVSFLERFLTQEERWVHLYKPETKWQSMQWKHSSSPTSKKAKVVSSAGMVMATVYWAAKGIVFIDYLQKGKTINGKYYANLLMQLRKAIKSKRAGKLTKGVLFHQDNAPAHMSVVAVALVHDCGFELVDHPPIFS
ncbi:histone-lysine N-methyltransferase SETMAR-like [Oratosquilla oratoria]|uniref:histone-lysine N-methyltransferase SETMAR-like n=1 Tax=Oratosquilla oratoria TaxID=337810 RepID=UPI003F75E10E